MVIDIDKRKIVLAKLLFDLAAKQARSSYSKSSRIMSVIGFDLAAETLLKLTVVHFNPSKQPPENFSGLLGFVESELEKRGMDPLSSRRGILHVHSLRNDAQHKGKYPNEDDVNDARTYTKDFCNQLTRLVWGLSFDDLSLLDFIDDETLALLLENANDAIGHQHYRRAVTISEFAFFLGSRSIRNLLPDITRDYSDTEYRDSSDLIRRLMNSSRSHTETALYFSALFATGISVADYRRFSNLADVVHFTSRSVLDQKGENMKTEVSVHWTKDEPDEESAKWAWVFVVNSLIYWQDQGIHPSMPANWKERARLVLDWEGNVKEFASHDEPPIATAPY